MKTILTLKTTAVLILAAAMTAGAQGPQGYGGQRNRGPQREEDDRSPPPASRVSAADLLEEFDADQDGKLNEMELTEALAALPRQPPAPEDIAAKWVAEHDADGNGELSPAELAQALEAHRPPRPPPGPRGNGPQDDRRPSRS